MEKVRNHGIFLFFILCVPGAVWFALRLRTGHLAVPSYGDMFTYLLLAPVAEELFFRGVMQDAAAKRIPGGVSHLTYANLLTSLFFVLVHIPFWGGVHALLVFFPSVAFGLMYDKTGLLRYPILLHAFYNLNIFIV